jgi:hypothetical protein
VDACSVPWHARSTTSTRARSWGAPQALPPLSSAIRNYFERVRALHVYGVLEYEFFSAPCDLTLLAIEAALRVRFVEHYSRRIPVVARASKVPLARGAISIVTTRGASRGCSRGHGGKGCCRAGARALLIKHSQEEKVALQFGRRGSQ